MNASLLSMDLPLANECLQLVGMRAYGSDRRCCLGHWRRGAGPLHMGFDQLAEANARGRFPTELPKRGPSRIVDRHPSDARPDLTRPNWPPARRRSSRGICRD